MEVEEEGAFNKLSSMVVPGKSSCAHRGRGSHEKIANFKKSRAVLSALASAPASCLLLFESRIEHIGDTPGKKISHRLSGRLCSLVW